MSNLNIRERDSPTHLHQFDANYGKIQYMSDPLDKHAPIKNLQKKKRDKLKPWVTKGMKKSMSVRDKIYKQMIKENDQVLKIEKDKRNKKY